MAKKPSSELAQSWQALGLPGAELPAAKSEELTEIFRLARQVHGEKARQWFLSPEPALGGVAPATLMRDPHNGPRLVRQSLKNSLHGPVR